MKKPDKYYRLTSFYIAAFLLAKGYDLVGVEPTEQPRRFQFVFIDTPTRAKLLQVFNFGSDNVDEVMCDARKLVAAIKTLKDKLYQSK